MKNSFYNGKKFQFFSYHSRVDEGLVPRIYLMAAYQNSPFHPVAGIVDTGASQTFLNEATAKVLRIKNIEEDSKRDGFAESASEDKMPYFIHDVFFNLHFKKEGSKKTISYNLSLEVGVNTQIRDNYFGADFLNQFCCVIDPQMVFFLNEVKEN